MQVTNINNNMIQIKSQGKASPFKSGTQFKATVTHVNNDGTVVLETDKGHVFTASNTSNFGLNVGDTVGLLVTTPSNDGSAAGTVITQINGQPIDQNVSLSELHLIDLGIMPNAQNLRLYNILNRHQMPLTKEYILNLKEILENLPGITDEQAAFMAANNIKPTQENLNALLNIGSLHKDISSILFDSLQQIMDSLGIDQNSVKDILSILNNIAVNDQQTDMNGEAIQNAPLENGAENILVDNQNGQAQTGQLDAVNDNQAAQSTVPSQNSQELNQQAVELNSNTSPIQTNDTVVNGEAVVISGNELVSDIQQSVNDITNYHNIQHDVGNENSDAVALMSARITNSVISSALSDIANNPEVTLKSIGELKAPEQLPPDLQLAIAALPEEVQNDIMAIIPKVIQSVKEFMSVKLINTAEQKLNIPIDKDISGLSLKKTLRDQPSNLNTIAVDKNSEAFQRTMSTLKLSDSTMCFVQIPVKINDFNTSAEMYVVKRDKNQELSLEDGIKMVFALNTEHLGRVESIISANTKDLQLNIRVENGKVRDAVQREMSYLKSLLNTTNFNILVLKVTSIDKPVTVFNAHTHFGYKQLDITV